RGLVAVGLWMAGCSGGWPRLQLRHVVPRGAADAASPILAGCRGPVSRPAGDPGALAAGARGMHAAAGALRDVHGRLRGATSFVVTAGAWKGPASEAFLVDGAG